MYADRISAGSKRSIQDRINVDFPNYVGRGGKASQKRQRQNDDKWKRDLFYDDREAQSSKLRVGPEDLRFKLQKKASQQAYQGGKNTGIRDLREKLSGTMHSQPPNIDLPKAKPTSDVVKPIKKTGPPFEASVSEAKNSRPSSSRKKFQQKSYSSVDGFIRSLGLEKYLILFQAEEIDMPIIMRMSDDDLKALGIPMSISNRTGKRGKCRFSHSKHTGKTTKFLEGATGSSKFGGMNGKWRDPSKNLSLSLPQTWSPIFISSILYREWKKMEGSVGAPSIHHPRFSEYSWYIPHQPSKNEGLGCRCSYYYYGSEEKDTSSIEIKRVEDQSCIFLEK